MNLKHGDSGWWRAATGTAWIRLVCLEASIEHSDISMSIIKSRLKPALASPCPNPPSQKRPMHFPSTFGTNMNWPDTRKRPRVFSFKGISDPEVPHVAPLVSGCLRLLCVGWWQSSCVRGWAVCWRCSDFLGSICRDLEVAVCLRHSCLLWCTFNTDFFNSPKGANIEYIT